MEYDELAADRPLLAHRVNRAVSGLEEPGGMDNV